VKLLCQKLAVPAVFILQNALAILFEAPDAQAPESLLHRLEPSGHRVLHGAGQSPDEFRDYFNGVGEHKPAIYMTYVGLREKPAEISRYFSGIKKDLESYGQVYLIPQIGLSMTSDGHPERHYEDKVAKGDMDANIDAFCEGLTKLDRPAFIRIGYEFNGFWNGYQPETYKAAWKRIVERLRGHGLENVATIWCIGAETPDYMKYYPGDDAVDWWGIDLFSIHQLGLKGFSDGFVRMAGQHGFPVMVCESTPQRVGVLQGEASWRKWFDPYFAFIAQHESVKAFCYISWNWAGYSQWSDWGDGRIASNAEVLDHYKVELKNPLYIHGGDPKATRALLHVK
jgi:hypothetical protein